MSAQAGIFYFDRRPITPELVARLDAPLREFGPDGGAHFVADGLVMVQRALHVTPEDRHERQPLVSSSGNVMTWDGRLDNRDDLLLQLWRDVGDDRTDVALAMAAYERWNVDAFSRLIGDWSVVVFDSLDRSIVLASDFMGVRPLYYCSTPEFLTWSSSLAGLVQLTGRMNEIDSGFVFSQLVGFNEPNLTPYGGILSLPPAHALIQSPSGQSATRRFWSYGQTTIESRRIVDYADQLRSVFSEALRARLRTTRSVWCELSGGLDSSSVACMAHSLIRAGAASTSLRFVSYVNDSSPESDERRFAEEVERYCAVPTCYVAYDDHPRGGGHWLTPVLRSPIAEAVARLMQASGDRVILTGRVGDGVMGNASDDGGSLSALVPTGRLKTFGKLAREWSRASKDPLVTVVGRSLEPFLPRSIRIRRARSAFLNARVNSTRGSGLDVLNDFSLNESFAARHEALLQAAIGRTLSDGCSRSPSVLRSVNDYATNRRLETHWWTPPIRWSHPFADRRVVEFVTSVPFTVLCPPGRPRDLMKAAFSDVLPTRIRNRFSKGYAAPYLTRALRPTAEWLLRDVAHLSVVTHGFVDPGSLAARLRAFLGGSVTSFGNLQHIAAVEGWLDAHAGAASHSPSSVGGIPLRPQAAAYERR